MSDMSDRLKLQPPPTMPPMVASEESTEDQLELARKQGEAYAAALAGMDEESGADIRKVGEYEVVLVVENAEGMCHLRDGELQWQEPEDENTHVEVAVRGDADGRFIPGLTVVVTITGPDGSVVGSHEQPFLWHPWLYHYGRNWRVPGDGAYRIHVPDRGTHIHASRSQQWTAVRATGRGRVQPRDHDRAEARHLIDAGSQMQIILR